MYTIARLKVESTIFIEDGAHYNSYDYITSHEHHSKNQKLERIVLDTLFETN